MFSVTWAAVGSVCLSTLVWSSSTILKEIPWLFPLPTCQFSFQGSFCVMWNRWPCRAEHCWQLPSLRSSRVRIPISHVWVKAPAWASNEPGAGSKDKIKPILKCSLLQNAEIGAYMPHDLIQLLFYSLRQELADSVEEVCFVCFLGYF